VRPTMSRFLAGNTGSALLALGLLSGCMVGPDFERPEAPELDSWSKGAGLSIDPRTGFTTRSAAAAEWWHVFKDPVLNSLIAEAYEQNLSLQAAGVRVYKARAQLGIARGELFPQSQQIGGGVKRERLSTNEPVLRDIRRFANVDPHVTRIKTGFDAGWELDVWGKIRRSAESAGANLAASIASYDDALVTLTGDVASTYVAIRELEQLIYISRRNARLQKESLRIAEVRMKNGVATELDVNEARVLYNNTLANIPKYQAQLAEAYNAMSVLLGEPPGGVQARLKGSSRLPAVPAEVAVGVPAELLRRRPDIRAAEYAAAAQSAQIGVAQADLYPAFTISGAIGVEAADFADLFSKNSLTGFINPAFSWNFLNYGRIRNNVRVQDATFQELLLNYKDTVLNAYAEVETALVAFLKSKQEAAYLARARRAARAAVREVQDQYKKGTAEYDRVVDAQKNLLTADERLLAAHADAVTNLIAVYKGLGGGWAPENIDGFISQSTRIDMENRTNWGRLLKPETKS
jgi:NodT family efflux transporter outer membrane factor (OMF) lipoprotein